MNDKSPPQPKVPHTQVASFEVIETDRSSFLSEEEKSWPIAAIQSRVDSFEVIEADCSSILTEEEGNWPIAAIQSRVDSFQRVEPMSVELALAEAQLHARFGPLASEVRQRVAELTPEQLRQLSVDLVKANSLQELRLVG